ncbi:pleckstrin homology domain-containing family A member 3-like [Pseudonaja textilis]|uniref:pleckstrin homology domain-containing family A member 3-like n=1 Tax=Pseudonaja textilis TaxID=8673 RepID=UPI000EA9042B|nr:pleckstrin homology domain-containing family A member 3-like [Pseudonaja textilis]
MNEASSLLSATCDTFITTLEECVKIANAKFKPEMFPLPHPDPLVSPVSPSPVQMMKRSVSHPGTCTLERSSRFGKEPNVSSHQLSHRWRRTVSDTEPSIDVPFEDTDRLATFNSRGALNGNLAPSAVPEAKLLLSQKPRVPEETFSEPIS